MSTKLDYLKKYLSSDKKSKKKNKVKKSRIKIIDDNEFECKNIDADDLIEFAGEDAPQIVNMEEFNASSENNKTTFVKSNWQNLSEHPQDIRKLDQKTISNDYDKEEKFKLNSDLSPKRNKNFTKNISSNLKYDRDLSPKRTKSGQSPIRKKPYIHNDVSPKKKSLERNNSDSDLSPRRISRKKDSDLSPLRKESSNRDSYLSYKRNNHRTERSRNSQNGDNATKKRTSRFNVDLSPRRKKTYNDDNSPTRRSRNLDNGDHKKRNSKSSSRSPIERKRYKETDVNKNSSKRLGFQDSSTLKTENKNLKAQEDEMLQNLYDKSNNIEPNVRLNSRRDDKRLKHDPIKELELQKKLETYRKWGKGLKQIEDYKSKQMDEINTVNKPLARYSNDADLEEMLRNTERAGDPMLEYLRKNKKDKNPDANSIPIYKGPVPQNRFNIRPGYRWDGVDRSNGYETKYFDVKNQKLAIQEEAYKYSTEDM